MTVSFSQLRAKEVIRLCDAESVGCVSDLLFDGESGGICALCVVPSSGWGAVFSGEHTVIPWDRIRCIGRETVLVDIGAGECRGCSEHSERGWRRFFSRRL